MNLWALFLSGGRNYPEFILPTASIAGLRIKQKIRRRSSFSLEKNLLLQIRITLVFIMATAFCSYGQKITISKTNVPLQTVFAEIEKQSKYQFFYNETLLQKASAVTVDVKNASVEDVLNISFKNQPLTYAMVDNTITVKRKENSQINDQVSASLSENITVNGKVTNSQGEPVAGATVSVKGSNVATATDDKGFFVLNDVSENAVLVVTSIAHLNQEIKLSKRKNLIISLHDKVDDLDEALVVAYNTTTQRSNVGAVSVVKGKQIETLPNRSVDKSLQGLVPGLLITQGTGRPGSGLANFVLRGISTGGSASDGATVRNPLIVIDGVPVFQDPAQATTSSVAFNNPMAQLNPSDIETISVLKDAAAVALYGSKASNGVILITTKKGKVGKTVFSFRQQTDISSRLKNNAKILNQKEYLELVYETFKNTDPGYWTDALIDSTLKSNFPVQPNGNFYPASDWLNEMFRNNATTFSNEFSLSGGNEKNNYYLNLEYTKQNGIEKNTGYDRKSIRFNYENTALRNIKIGLNSTMSYNVQDYSYAGWSEQTATLISPLNPIRGMDNDYIYNYTWGLANTYDLFSSPTEAAFNPVAAKDLNINRNVSYRGLSKLYAKIGFLKYFSFIPSVGVDFMLTEAKEKIHPKFAGDNLLPDVGRIQATDIRRANLITTNILRFDKLVNRDHNVNVLIGQEAQILTNSNNTIARENLTSNPATDQLNIGSLYYALGLSDKQTLLSYFGQANYAFRNKYFLSGSIRTDGSSLFGENKRFGTHWSAGAGWLVTGEQFMNPSGWLNYLKIRGSIGSAGNSSAILNTIRYDALIRSTFLNSRTALSALSVGNPDIQWEKTFTWDAGIELQMFKERIAVTADVYTKKTSKVIANTNLPWTSGFTSFRSNIGDLKNNGIELSVSADLIRNSDFRWTLNANWSKNENRLVRSFFPVENVSSGVVANVAGENYNSFYIPQWAGVDPATGMPQWMDSTGKPNSTFSAAKKIIAGKPQPDGFGSVTNTFFYKGFELSAMLYYQYGFQVFNNPAFNPMVNDGLDPFMNQSKAALNRWQKPGDISPNPQRLLFDPNGGTSSSTRYILDGDFIRLSNVSLAYNFPKKIIDRLRLGMLRIYIQGYNLAVWTKYDGRQDPENTGAFGTAQYSYPLQRSFSIGLNLNF